MEKTIYFISNELMSGPTPYALRTDDVLQDRARTHIYTKYSV